MINRCILIFTAVLFTIVIKANAQTIQGKVYELKTHIALQSIRVINLNTKQNAVTDTAGIFYINAKTGDVLTLRGYAYQPDTLVITGKNRLEIYLQPQGNLLKEVNVATPDVKIGSLKDPTLNNQTAVYQRDKNNNYQGGIAIRFGYGKDKKSVRNQQRTADEMASDEIDEVFSTQNISKSVPLRGQELQNFVMMYRPELKVYKDPNFNLAIYINDSYKKYLALPPDQRKPQKLNTDTGGH